MILGIEIEREDDGRWLAEVRDLPGVLAYGRDRDEALAAVKALALRVLADRLEHGEAAPDLAGVSAYLPGRVSLREILGAVHDNSRRQAETIRSEEHFDQRAWDSRP